MFHLVVFHSRLTQPILLKYTRRTDALEEMDRIFERDIGDVRVTDHFNQTMLMARADIAAMLVVDHQRGLEAQMEEALAQHRQQQLAQSRVGQMPVLAPGGVLRQ